MRMYYNRDLSWLEFNYRVLREAACEEVPLYDRIKFLAIFSSNFDEFFSIRYPVILAISKLKAKKQRKIDEELSDHSAEYIQREIERQYKEFASLLTGRILPDLRKNNVFLYYNEPIKQEHMDEVREIFLSNVLSFLQPIFLNADIKNFSPEANKIYMIFSLRKEKNELLSHAVVKVPVDNLKRFYHLSPIEGVNYVVFIDDIIKACCSYIFPGFTVDSVYSIKFNRNQDILFREDYRGDTLKRIKKQLAKRLNGFTTRFLYEHNMPRNIQLYLSSIFGVSDEEIFSGECYHNLSDLFSFPDFGLGLKYEEWKPLQLLKLSSGGDIFKRIEQGDILLHFPYHSYNPILFFFNQAAIDPDVVEIYITLYRLASDSLIANALISAARNGKKVIVFIELKARFDEANNIAWSEKMKRAGVQIIYSIPGIKVHTKIALVVKVSKDIRTSYSVISTGNFNEFTARFYSDHSLLTVDKTVNNELLTLFQFLQKRIPPPGGHKLQFNKLFVSQFNMADSFRGLIQAEIKKAEKKGKGFIRIKINNLEEPGMIDMLYNASIAGVTVQLIVRSICCLIPGVTGRSENIEVKRLVDRYLEHTRIFIFGEDEEAVILMGSSDWMTRNLYHRIELCVPVTNTSCRKELIDYFGLQWRDNDKVQVVNSQVATANVTDVVHNGQQSIYNYLKNAP